MTQEGDVTLRKMSLTCLASLLALALCLGLLPTAAWAAGGDIDDWETPEAPETSGSWTDTGNYDITWYTDITQGKSKPREFQVV